MDTTSALQRLDQIQQAIGAGEYRSGMWQAFVNEADCMDETDRRAIAAEVSETSRQLHGLNGFPQVPFGSGLSVEILLFGISLWLMSTGHLLLTLAGLAALALSLQPLIKIIAGLCLGIRYDYVYLWYFEPRFKMQFGTYLATSPGRRVVFHLAGSIGTPIAMLAGYFAFAPMDHWMSDVCLVFAVVAGLMQVGAFCAEWAGVRRVAGYRLSNLTSPATAAFELKRLRRG